MNDHTICVRLDNADPGKKYRVVFDGEHRTDPDEDGLFWFFDAQPMRRYRIGCEVMSDTGEWQEGCPDITLNFVPPPFKSADEPIVHRGGGEKPYSILSRHMETRIRPLRGNING